MKNVAHKWLRGTEQVNRGWQIVDRPTTRPRGRERSERLWRMVAVLAVALMGSLLSVKDLAAQCQNTFTAVPLNVTQTYTFVTDPTNTSTFPSTPCDPYGKGVFDTYAHALLPEQVQEGPIVIGQIIGATYGNYYVGGTPGAEYIQFMPTSNPGFAYTNIVTYWVRTGLGPISNTITFFVNAAPLPTVSSISTAAGPTTSGSSITITGTNLTGATGVSFGGTAATSFTVNSATSISVTAPAHAAGVVDVTVTTPNGTSATSSADQYTFVAAPAITSLTPTYGTDAGGTNVTITGTNLASGTQILFNGTAGTAISSTTTSATVTTPAHAAGQVDVTLTTAGGTSPLVAGDHFTFVSPPTASASSTTVAYNSSANSVTLNTSGGPTSVSVASQASHGLATASGTSITYTPTAGYFGSDSFTYTATNSVGTSSAATVSITVSGPTITVSPTTLTSGTYGSAYNQSLSASGGQSPYTFSTTLASGALPAGLTLSSSGAVTGTPTAAGTFTFTVSGTDSSSTTHASFTSSTITLVIAPVAPGTPTVGTASAGNLSASVAFTPPASNGGATITSYTVTSSPGGIAATGSSSPITVTGLTNGTSYTFTVTATNSAGTSPASSPSNSVTPTGAPVAMATSAAVAYNSTSNAVTLNLSGGAPTTVAVTSAASHGTAAASGTTITYTPVTGFFGTDSFTYNATNSFGTSSVATITVIVTAPVITVTPTALPTGVTLAAYSQQLTATGGKAPYTFSTTVASGALPLGYTISSTGLISGTAAVAGTYTFTVTGTDSSTLTHATFTSSTITLNVNALIPVVPGAPNIGTATAGNQQATVTFTPPGIDGGSPVTGYTVISNPGNITATGAASPITVTGLTNGVTYQFFVAAINSVGTGAYSFPSNSVTPIAAPIAGSTNATVTYDSSGTPITLNLTGGSPTSVAVVSPASHGTATASGTTVTYTPSTGFYGSDSFIFNASNGTGTSSTATATITINAPIITVTPATLASDTVGSTYSQSLTASGGQAPYTFSTVPASGALPAGLSLSSSGAITGTPTTAGTSPFTVTGTDSSTPTHATFTSSVISLTISAVLAGAPTIGTATAGDSQATVTFTPPASNGGSPITSYTVTSSPGGITATGTGSPITVTGLADGTSYTFTVTATNAAGVSSASASSNAVTPVATPIAGSASLTVAYNSTANAVTLNLTGGAATSVAVVTAAAHGTATATGTSIAYTPTAGFFGTDSFTYTATNGTGTSSPATVTVTISVPTITVSPTTLAAGTFGTAYSQSIFANGGQAPYTFSTTPATGAFPTGLTLSTSGAVTGTPTAAGTFTFTVTGADSSTATHATFTSGTITLTINAGVPGAPTVGTATAGNTQATVTFTPPASSDGSTITGYTVTSSPGGLTATGASSPITLTGLTNGTSYTFTVAAANAIGTGPASSPSNSITPKAPQTITFSNPGTQSFNSSPTLTATASSSLAVTFSSMTPGVCTISSGGLVTFVTAGICTIAAGQSGNASYTAAPEVTQSFTVTATLPGAPLIGTATAGNTQATVAFTPPASNGGVPITSYTVTSNPGGIPASGTGSPITITGLINNTAYIFTVTATNSVGTSPSSVASNSITPSTAVTAGATTATVAYNSTANPITLNLSGGSPTSVAVASAASHGTATASGTTITYTPTTGYYGPDSFTYTATNASGTSAAATVSITVSAPIISVSPTMLAAGTVGTAYSQSLTASGGKAPYLFSTVLASGALPTGLTLSTAGTISGVPTAGGTFTFTVSGTDSSTGSGPASFTSATLLLTIGALLPGAPTVGTATPGNAQATVSFTPPVSNGGSAITSYTVTSNPGSITATGSGSPITVTSLTNGTAYTFTVTATNSAGTGPSSSPSNPVTVAAAPIAGAVTATVAYNSTANPITLALSGGTATSVAVASAASHGTATATGTSITYTPINGFFGTDTFTYTATNGTGTSSPATVTITVSAPTITVTPTTLPNGTDGSFYAQTITPSGGQAPYIFSTTPASGALPAGLSIAATGVITGTPTAAGNFTFTVSGNDSSTPTHATFISTAITLTIAAVVPGAPTGIAAASSGNGQASVSFTAPASNGGAPITSYTVTSVPGGITTTGTASPITITGLTNGTPYTFLVTASNSAGTGPSSLPSNAVITQAIQTITFPNPGTIGFATPLTLMASATSGLPISYSSTTPSVCTVNATTGVATFVTAGTCTLAADQAGNAAFLAATEVAITFTITAVPPGTPTIISATAGNAQSVVTFMPPLINGGSPITSYTVTSNPGGITGTGTGTGSPITVSPLANGTSYTFTVTATNSAGTGPSSIPSSSVTPSASVTATQAIASETLTQNHAATSFTPVVGGSGAAPLSYSVAPALPVGLMLLPTTGSITGMPTAASAATTYTVTVTDANNATATANFSLTINGPVTVITGVAPPVATVGVTVAPFTPITGSGGTAPFTYTVSPALPAALTINPATGQITGTPASASAATTYTVTVTDSNGATATASFSLTINAPLVAASKSIAVAYNSTGTTSTPIDLTSSVTGGTPTLISVITAPSHGTTTVNGLIVTYTPTQGFYGSDSFTYTGAAGSLVSSIGTVSITIPAPVITAASDTLPGGAVNVAYSQTIVPIGGAAPYTFATTASGGTLPAGVTLSSTGVLSGTPTAACTCTFTLTGTDSSTGTGPVTFSLTLSLTIVAGAPTVTAVTPNVGLSAGGTSTTITGTNFTDTSIVSFGSVPATSVTYISTTSLMVIVPATPAQGNAVKPRDTGGTVVDVTVTTPGGTSAITPADQFFYLAQAGALSNPLGTTVDGQGNTFIADSTLGYIVEIPASCTSIACEKIIGSGLTGLTGVTVDSDGDLYALSGGATGTVAEFTYDAATGTYVQQTTAASCLNLPTTLPTGITVDDMGNLYVTDTADHTIVEEPYNPATGTYGSPITLSTGSAESTPSGIVVDANGDVFYADPGTGTIDELTPGSTTPIVLASGVNAQSVALDASGNLYYTDSVTGTVTKLPFDGTSYGASVVIATGLSTPYGLSVDDNGNLLVANNGTQSLIKVTLDTPPSFTYANTKAGATSTDSPHTATLANIGTDALTFAPSSAANPTLSSGYALNSATTCPQLSSTSSPQTVAQGASCTYAVSFTPADANVGSNNAPDSGSLTLRDDNLNATSATQSIALTGIALPDDVSAVALTLNPASPIVFGNFVVLTATVSDIAVPATIPTGNVDFTVSTGAAPTPIATVPLTAGSATVPAFKPSAAGTYTLAANYTGAVGDIAASSTTVSLIVTRATPTLTYKPLPVTQAYGTPILASALDATAADTTGAPIPGTFVYTTAVNATPVTLVAGTTVLPAATYTITATFTPTDTANYISGGTVTATYTVTATTATVTLGDLSQSYTGQPHTVTATTVPASLSVTLTYNGSTTPPTAAGSYTVVGTIADTADYSGTATATLVIAKAPVTSVTLVATPNPVLTTTPVTLTATVTSPLSTPTGSVNFVDSANGTVFATAPLVNGVATFNTNAEPIGVYNLVADYLGDTDFLPLESPVFVSTVLSFSVTIATVDGSSSTATAAPGGTADYAFSLVPDGSPTFTDPVTFTISGQPAGSTYTITPSMIPAGSGPTDIALSIQLPQQRSMLHRDARNLAPFALALLLLPFAGRLRRSGRRFGRALALLVLLNAGIGATATLSSCGTTTGFSGGSASGPKTYTITLTGTSGKLTRSTTVTLNVP